MSTTPIIIIKISTLSELLRPFANLYQEFVTSHVVGLAQQDSDPVYGLNQTQITRGDLRKAYEIYEEMCLKEGKEAPPKGNIN